MSASSAKEFLSSRLSHCEKRHKLVRSAPDLASLCRDFNNGCNVRSDGTIWSSNPRSKKSYHIDLDGKVVNDSAIASDASFLAAVGSISRTTPLSATGSSDSIRSAPNLVIAREDRKSGFALRRQSDCQGIHLNGSASLENLHGLVKNTAVASDGSITTPSSATSTWTTTTMADISSTSSSAISYAPHTYTRKSSAPELRAIQQRDATSGALSPRRSWSSVDSHAMVNLNAKTFIGNRRDRFRPREQRRRISSCSGLSRLNELL